MRMSDLLNADEALKLISSKPLSTPHKTFKLAKLLKEAKTLVETYYDTEKKYLTQYGTPTGDGQYHIPQESVEEFKKSMDDLLNEEIEFETKLNLVLDDIPGNELGATHILALEWLLDEQEETEE